MREKPLVWVGSTLERIRAFPRPVRAEIGHQLHLVQIGLEPADWKPMPAVGAGVIEIRLRGQRDYRTLYIARFQEAIYVLHAFEKRSQRTRGTELDLARRNLSEVLRHRPGR